MLDHFVEGAEYPKRRIQASIVTLIKKARGCRQAVEVAAASSKITLSSLEQALHLADFDELVIVESWSAGVCSELDKITDELSVRFTTDAEQLMSLMRSQYPAWTAKRESLLDDVDMCQRLMSTTESVYLNLGPMAKELRRIADVADQINSDRRSPLFLNVPLKEIRAAADEGVETVSLIFVLSFLQHEMGLLRNQVLRTDAAKKVRKRAAEKMKVPQQILDVLTEYEDGERTAELFPQLKKDSDGQGSGDNGGQGSGTKGSDGKGSGGKGGKGSGSKGLGDKGSGDGRGSGVGKGSGDGKGLVRLDSADPLETPRKRPRLTGRFGLQA